MRLRCLSVLITIIVGCATAFAQNRNNAEPMQTPRISEERVEAPKPLNNNDAELASQAMQRNGGSLLRATISRPADPGQANLGHVSYFAVPEPQPRVIRKHDNVTIIIREESAFSSEGTTETKKQAALRAQIREFMRLDLRQFELKAGGIGANAPTIDASASRQFTGEGTVDRTDKLTARITATVLDVKPNGTLVLQGRKEITTDDEYQRFLVTGICRAEDISADNTVLSTQMADFNLRKTHRGNVRNATQKGWAGKILDALNPF